MGSMIHLAVGRLEIDWGKNNSFNDHSALFQPECDLAEVPYHYAGKDLPDGGFEIITELKVGLAKPLRLVRDRLELMGCTLGTCEREFLYLADFNGFDPAKFTFKSLADALAQVDVQTLASDYGEGGEDFGEFFKREIAPRLKLDEDLDWSVGEAMENLSAHSVLRLLAENPKAIDLPVNWAFADVEDGGWADRGDFVKALDPADRLLIVTEGSSDAKILKHALWLLRPHVADFFNFVDMEEGYPFSGTGNVYRFVQGLIGIAVQNNILVVFDNDAEGVANCRRTAALALPRNMRVLRLPDIDNFAAFKTIGPTGENPEDMAGKDKTFILDFQNTIEDIQAAFRPYFEVTTLEANSDPNQVYDLEARIRAFAIIDLAEVDRFAEVYFRGALTPQDRIALEQLVRNAVQRFEAEEEDGRREEFRQLLRSYMRFYAFVAQVISLSDTSLEKLYAYVGWLVRLLPNRQLPPEITITDDMLRLRAFRVQQREAGSASLSAGDRQALPPITEFGAQPYTEEEERSLSEIIDAFNERHGTEFSREDFMRFEQVNRDILDDDMSDMLRNNPPDVVFGAFSQAFFEGAIRLFQRENQLQNIVMTDPEAREKAIRHFFSRALREARGA